MFFIGSWLFFRLFLSTNYMFCFTFSIGVVGKAIFVISSVVNNVYVCELDVKFCDIFLEKLNSASRRNENSKRFSTTRY
jgi:hypothetical protein